MFMSFVVHSGCDALSVSFLFLFFLLLLHRFPHMLTVHVLALNNDFILKNAIECYLENCFPDG
ncbi:hypothetical protein BJX66DRAFT_304555 [Aspergillus keveii]|uniref:Secreted protein n=1 Tax=Aspergillus keveii TaxID=714993 RepID=A0ABR4G564_9EURO